MTEICENCGEREVPYPHGSRCEVCDVSLEGKDAPWRDANILRRLYHKQNMSLRDIADELGCGDSTVEVWMDKHDIPTRSKSMAVSISQGALNLTVHSTGYEEFRSGMDNNPKTIKHHRLLAVAEYGFKSIKGMHVHHKNGIKWDNRPENIELLTPREHLQRHIEQGDVPKRFDPAKNG